MNNHPTQGDTIDDMNLELHGRGLFGPLILFEIQNCIISSVGRKAPEGVIEGYKGGFISVDKNKMNLLLLCFLQFAKCETNSTRNATQEVLDAIKEIGEGLNGIKEGLNAIFGEEDKGLVDPNCPGNGTCSDHGRCYSTEDMPGVLRCECETTQNAIHEITWSGEDCSESTKKIATTAKIGFGLGVLASVVYFAWYFSKEYLEKKGNKNESIKSDEYDEGSVNDETSVKVDIAEEQPKEESEAFLAKPTKED